MASEMECPCCGWRTGDRKHPKDSSTVSAHVLMLNHLNVYHQREIQERLARSAAKEKKE